MPQFDDNHVKLQGGIIVWDGVTQPETVTQGQQAGKLKYTLKVVFEPHNPDVALYDQLANKALLESKWRGTLPAGGRMPIGTVQAGEFNDQFPGWRVISFKTTLKLPDVYDDSAVNGPKLVDNMQLASYIYTGQKVDVLAHCYEYDAAGNKGISAGLDAIDCIMSAQMPRQQFGNGLNTAAAFGGGAPAGQPAPGAAGAYQPQQPAQQPAPGAYGATPSQAHDFLPGGPGAPAGPSGPGPATPEIKYRTHDGAWTEAQLLQAGYTPQQIQALPRA